MAKQQLTWTNEKRKLRDLAPWEHNPRRISGANKKRLSDSREEFGQTEPLLIGPDNDLYNGHQRLKSWAETYGPDFEIDVRVSNRALTKAEREKLTVLIHRGATGDWDFSELADWDLDSLIDWGFDDIGSIAEAAELTEIHESEMAESNDRDLGDKRKQVKPVLYTDEVEIFERAIRATGNRNRGKAIIDICSFYLEQHGEETEGQFDFTFEDFFAEKPA